MRLRCKTLVPTCTGSVLLTGISLICVLLAGYASAIDDPAPALPPSLEQAPLAEPEGKSPTAEADPGQSDFANPLLSDQGIHSLADPADAAGVDLPPVVESPPPVAVEFSDLSQLQKLGRIHRVSAVVDPSDDPNPEIEVGQIRLLPRGAFESLQWASQQQPDGAPVPAEAGNEPSASDAPPAESSDATAETDEAPFGPAIPIPPLSVRALGFAAIHDMTVDISTRDVAGDQPLPKPEDLAGPKFKVHGEREEYRHVNPVGLEPAFFLQPAEFCYQPLYFEELNLERYGTSKYPLAQPVLSGAHFFATVPAMPYLMSWKLPRRCYYDTASYFPGRAAPWQRELPPLRSGPSAVEAAVITGAIIALP